MFGFFKRVSAGGWELACQVWHEISLSPSIAMLFALAITSLFFNCLLAYELGKAEETILTAGRVIVLGQDMTKDDFRVVHKSLDDIEKGQRDLQFLLWRKFGGKEFLHPSDFRNSDRDSLVSQILFGKDGKSGVLNQSSSPLPYNLISPGK